MSDVSAVNPYRSPTLDHLDRIRERSVSDEVACVDCPKGVWYWAGDDDLTCFCSAMHQNMWSRSGKRVIRFCDAREQAIADLAQAAEAGQRS